MGIPVSNEPLLVERLVRFTLAGWNAVTELVAAEPKERAALAASELVAIKIAFPIVVAPKLALASDALVAPVPPWGIVRVPERLVNVTEGMLDAGISPTRLVD